LQDRRDKKTLKSDVAIRQMPLAYNARQRDDQELDIWMSEIRLRAVIRIAHQARCGCGRPATRAGFFCEECRAALAKPRPETSLAAEVLRQKPNQLTDTE
jgi:hypothetical protein